MLVRKGDYTLAQTSFVGHAGHVQRGTCSPGFKLVSGGLAGQVLPIQDCSTQTMVPYSHILWASLWWGIAANAVARAAEFVRGTARKTPGVVPPTAIRLAEISERLQAMRHNWLALAIEFDDICACPERNG